jgi:hypothetical protein
VTVTFRSLGFSSLTGKRGIDQANTFKRQIRSVLGPSEVSLVMATERESGGCEVRAVYDRDDAGQVEWVSRAEGIADEIWRTLRMRRMGLVP